MRKFIKFQIAAVDQKPFGKNPYLWGEPVCIDPTTICAIRRVAWDKPVATTVGLNSNNTKESEVIVATAIHTDAHDMFYVIESVEDVYLCIEQFYRENPCL